MSKKKAKVGLTTAAVPSNSTGTAKPSLSRSGALKQKKQRKCETAQFGKGKMDLRRQATDRRAKKMAIRKKEKKPFTADMWAEPAPAHLVAKLDLPQVKTKYQSYFEFADNPEKKKKLEYQLTTDAHAPPGYSFVPIGDPVLTNACKELSRERGAMIFIVSTGKEENSKISEHVHRIGFHFREAIVEDASKALGERAISNPKAQGCIEPIPDTQEQINQQADAAIRDLFPRIPNTDRQMIIEHAFKKGGMFHGEPTVGLQSTIPLSRRVQLAVLAHIRHNHTRYDKLLRETSWMNARKVVEPVCLDVILKWRGDEETGRDQMDEILREVVIITDSENDDEDEDDESSDDNDSDDEGEVTSISSPESVSRPSSRNDLRPLGQNSHMRLRNSISPHSMDPTSLPVPLSRPYRGFKRYQAAWEEAVNRRLKQSGESHLSRSVTPLEVSSSRQNNPSTLGQYSGSGIFSYEAKPLYTNNLDLTYTSENTIKHHTNAKTHPDLSASRRGQSPRLLTKRAEVTVRPHAERASYYQDLSKRHNTPIYDTVEDRSPQIVQTFTARHVLQDMLAESIETSSNRVISPRLDDQHGFPDTCSNTRDLYLRRAVEYRDQSPASRQVIIIDDDSPEAKHRHVAPEDEFVRLRSLVSHEYASQPDSRLISTSSVGSGCFMHQQNAPQQVQGMFREARSVYTDPTTAEQLPVYDASEAACFSSHSLCPRRANSGRISGTYPEIYDLTSLPSEHPSKYDCRRSINVPYRSGRLKVDGHEGNRRSQPNYDSGHQRLLSQDFCMPPQTSRVHDKEPIGGEHPSDHIPKFSQSHIDGSIPHQRDGFTVFSERVFQDSIAPQHYQQHLYHPANSSTRSSSCRVRSPTYVQRPRCPTHQIAGPLHHEQRQDATYPRSRILAPRHAIKYHPSHSSSIDSETKRRVVVLD